MSDVFITIAIGIIKGVAIICDTITFLPWYFLSNYQKTLRQSNRLKAKAVSSNGFTAYRCVDSLDELTISLFPECKTIDDQFQRAVKLYGPLHCLGTREQYSEKDEVQSNGKVFKKAILANHYDWQTYDEVNQKVKYTGSGLKALGQMPKQNICIFAETQANWIIAAHACFKYNFPVVTLYATLGDDAIIHGINESDVSFVVTSADLLPKFKKFLGQIPKVTHLIYMEGYKKPNLEDFPSNIKVLSFDQVQELGARPENIGAQISKPVSSDLAVLMYTSGSTGNPKGVMISHGNLLAAMSGQVQRVPGLGPGDVSVCYLPLAHVLELACEVSCTCTGAAIGYSSPQTLMNQSTKIMKGCKGDVAILKPTVMAAVPLIMDRMYKAVWEKVNDGGSLAKILFGFGYKYKQSALERGYRTPLCDRILFKKIKYILGGKLRMILSGGAPLSKDTQRFMNVCFCCPVGQGYGLTETCGAGTVHEVADLSVGYVGPPLTCTEIVLRDWEEGGYTSKDMPNPRGEIVLGGGSIAQGYYKNPEKTAEEFFVKNGVRYFCTGDIGEINTDGTVKIIDRKKDLVKLQAGEYVSLGKLETVLKLEPIVDNLCAYADSSKMYTVAIVTPNAKKLEVIAKKFGLEGMDFEEICKNTDVEKDILKTLQQRASKGKLERFEIPQRIVLVSDLWTPDTGLVTDAFKLKRRNIQTKYQSEINRMYA